MKAVMVTFNQAHHDDIVALMERLDIKGYTGWDTVFGAGSRGGEPHLGSHAWPTLNSAIWAVIEEEQTLQNFMTGLSAIDEESTHMGLRAFWWEIGGSI